MSKILYKFQILILSLCLVVPALVFAENAQIELQVDRSSVRLGETVQLQVIVKGTNNASQPQIPKSGDFNLSYLGQSSQFQMINTTITQSTIFNYRVLPLKVGKFNIGPVRIDNDGKELASNTVTINIMAADAQPAASEQRDVFLKAKVSEESPYYNQQIVYTLKFGRRVQIANARVEMPTFDGFTVEELGGQKDYQENINGQNYIVTEIKKSLFPNKTGKISIKPAIIECDVFLPTQRRSSSPFDSFFAPFRQNVKNEVLHTPAIDLDVKPLPEKDKPAGFLPLVGDIKLKSDWSKTNLETGDSSTLTVTISGNANVRDAVLIEPSNIKDFKIYDDQPKAEVIAKDDWLMGKKVFKKALVPLNPGEQDAPVFKIAYFNPKTKAYEYAETSPQKLIVAQSLEKENLKVTGTPEGVVAKESIEILGKDIMGIHTNPESLENSQNGGLLSWIFFLLPPGAFAAMVSMRTRSKWYVQNSKMIRKRKAYKSAEHNLKKAATLAEKPAEFYPYLSRTIKEYLGDKLTLPAGSLTPQESQIKLAELGIEAQTISQLKDLMDQCDYYQFASASKDKAGCQSMLDYAKNVLAQLEKRL